MNFTGIKKYNGGVDPFPQNVARWDKLWVPHPWTDDQWQDIEIIEGYTLWIFEEAFLLTLSQGKEEELLKIGVSPGLRLKGIGKKLIENFIQEKRPDKIFLEVSVTNLGAIRFYKGLGFRKIHHEKRLYGDGEGGLRMFWSGSAMGSVDF